MSDPKGTVSRGSKTAAVVMLVVFLQVLVVAVLGLGAISRERKEVRRTAEDRARQEGQTAIANIVRAATAEVSAALVDVRFVKRYDDLERLRTGAHSEHADLIGTVYHLDPDTGRIYWLDGDHRLYVPPQAREALMRGEEAAAEDYASLKEGIRANVDPDFRLPRLIRLVRSFPYRLDPRKGNFPVVLGDAIVLARDVQEYPLFQPPDEKDRAYGLVEDGLLAALEAVALNRDREDDLEWSDRPLLEVVEDEVLATATALRLERGDIWRHVEAFRDARRRLEEGLRPVLDVAIREGATEDTVLLVGSTLVGLVPNVRAAASTTNRLGAALLNEEALLQVLQEKADAVLKGKAGAADVEDRGLELKIVRVEEPRPLDVVAARNLRNEPLLRLPYRAELHRTRILTVPTEGPGELFYWGIIALAAGGLGMGAYVLTRLYTREVRLARLKADFVSNLSHELKTPLTSIGLFTEMLHEGQLTNEADRQEGLAILAQESDRLQGIVARMLETARREARGVEYVLEPGDLNEIVGKAAERFRRIVTEPGLDLVVALHPGPLPILMDVAALDDVVANLVSNAWKYRRDEEAHVEVRTTQRGRKAELVVSDDGIGIPRRDRRRVFEMFYRSDAYLTKVAGTGLGLSLVRTIVRAHKGSIRVEPGENGRGSLFRLRFPLTKATLATSDASPVAVASSLAGPRSEAQATP